MFHIKLVVDVKTNVLFKATEKGANSTKLLFFEQSGKVDGFCFAVG